MDQDQLLKDCLKRKPEAQRKLYEHFAPSMLGLCFKYTKSMNDAEEVWTNVEKRIGKKEKDRKVIVIFSF